MQFEFATENNLWLNQQFVRNYGMINLDMLKNEGKQHGQQQPDKGDVFTITFLQENQFS